MLRLLVISILLGGCSEHGSGGPFDQVSSECAQARAGDTCREGLHCAFDEGGLRPTTCDCTAGHFICNDCPSEFSPPAGACEAGDSCNWETWEHGCACGCGTNGQWQCSPETIGSVECAPPPDAGI